MKRLFLAVSACCLAFTLSAKSDYPKKGEEQKEQEANYQISFSNSFFSFFDIFSIRTVVGDSIAVPRIGVTPVNIGVSEDEK